MHLSSTERKTPWSTQLLIIFVTIRQSLAGGHYEESQFHTSVHYVRIYWSNIGTIIRNWRRFLQLPRNGTRSPFSSHFPSAHASAGQPPVHIRFRLFLAISIHSRGRIIRWPERATIWKGNRVFPGKKSARGNQENDDSISSRISRAVHRVIALAISRIFRSRTRLHIKIKRRFFFSFR